MTLLQIKTSYFVAGIITDDAGKVIEAAPILKWTIGKRLSSVIQWVNQKGGSVEMIS